VDFIEGRLNPKIKLIGGVTLIAAQIQVREELAHLA